MPAPSEASVECRWSSDDALDVNADVLRAGIVRFLRGADAIDRSVPRFDWVDLLSVGQRPGRGGKQTRIDKTYVTDATRELIEQLGTPQTVTDRGATVLIWELDPEGNGLLVARLSGDDLRKGETAFGQVHELRALVEQTDVRARWLLVALRLSGRRDYERRTDFQFLEHAVREYGTAWVAYCNPDRIARHGFSHETFYARMQELDLGLYLGSLGRKVDWERDRLYLQITGVLSEHDRNRIVSKMTTSRERMWPLAGRGWPSSYFLGLERDEHDFFRVDPVQWPFIERIFLDYPLFSEKASGGLRGLARHLTALGCPIERDMVRKILTNSIYVDGRWWVNVRGQRVEQRPVELPNSVPREIFDHNLALLSAKRPSGRAVVGKSLLSGIPVVHEACQHEVGREGLPVTLKVNFEYDRYYHWPRTPAQCKGWAVDREVIDDAVIDALLDLARDAGLREAWSEAARAKWPPDLALRADSLSVLATRRRNLTAQRDRIVRQWIDAAANNTADTPLDAFIRATQAIDEEIAAIERRITIEERAEALRAHAQHRTDAAREKLLSEMERVLRCPAEPTAWRRRTLFVQSVLSRVIVRDTDDGISIELQGPLIPRDGPPIVGDPLSALAVGASDLSAYQLIRRHARSRPAWIMPSRTVRAAATRRARLWENVLEGVRMADSALPPGRFGRSDLATAWRALAARGELPSYSTFQEATWRLSVSGRDIVIRALGRERAFRGGRISPHSAEEIELVMRVAIAEGLDLEAPRWHARLGAWAVTHPYLPTASSLDRWLRLDGTSLAQLRLKLVGDAASE